MAFEPLKRVTLAIYLRLALKRLDALTVEVKRLADTQDLLLKLEAMKANIPLSVVRTAEEDLQQPAQAMELLSQTPEELDELENAYEHAEARYGRGKVPGNLDLYSLAATLKPDNPDEEA